MWRIHHIPTPRQALSRSRPSPRVAAEQHRSEAEVIRSALAEYTDRERPRPRAGTFSHGSLADRVDELLREGFGGD